MMLGYFEGGHAIVLVSVEINGGRRRRHRHRHRQQVNRHSPANRISYSVPQAPRLKIAADCDRPEAVIERKKWTAMLESYEVHVIAEQYDFKFGLPTDSTPHGAATAPIAACAVRSRFHQRSRT
jgi:hypothetical protein